MKLKIIKGTNQIGGCITEITSSQNTKIIIDFGEDLPDDNKVIESPKIKGLTTGIKEYDAVFITHSHGDHIGLIDKIIKDIPIYIEEKTMLIYEKTINYTSREFNPNFKVNITNAKEIKFEEPIFINDIKVTAYRTDHSSYNSCMYLIECDGKKILHTGDFRSHGRKENDLDNIIKKIKNVDLLIVEGTTLGRSKKEYMTEKQLEKEAEKLMSNYEQVFILQSSTNIDRITSFYKAKKDKAFIMDMFTCEIVKDLSKSIPNPFSSKTGKNYRNLFTYKPMKYKNEKEKLFQELYKHREFNNWHRPFIMYVKSSMLKDIIKVHNKNSKAVLIYSMWEGYITKQEKMAKFKENIESEGIDFKILHTSGHADIKTLKKLDKGLSHPVTIPIHTYEKHKAKKIFKHTIILEDNQEIEV